jgi:hypothetical protein
MSVTVAPATIAPVVSVTIPVTEDVEDVVWAETAIGNSSKSSEMTSKRFALVILFSLLMMVKAMCLETMPCVDTVSADWRGGSDAKIDRFITHSSTGHSFLNCESLNSWEISPKL